MRFEESYKGSMVRSGDVEWSIELQLRAAAEKVNMWQKLGKKS
jgi:hypothetical protein